jgi:hypothetical protein
MSMPPPPAYPGMSGMGERETFKPKRDWTWNERGQSNSSPIFEKLCGEVERLIRSDAHSLINGNAGSTARLIMAQLAHVHGLKPTRRPRYPSPRGGE